MSDLAAAYTLCALNALLSHTLPPPPTLCDQRLMACITVGTAANTQLAPQMHSVLASLVEPRQDVCPGEVPAGGQARYWAVFKI